MALSKRGPGACHNCDDPNHESRDCPKPCRECGSDKHRIGFHYRTGSTKARPVRDHRQSNSTLQQCRSCRTSMALVGLMRRGW